MHLRTKILPTGRLILIGTAILFCGSAFLVPAARADTPSVSIQSVFPIGGINPGQTVSFFAPTAGFANASYALKDSFGGTSVTSSDITSTGLFTWTPVVGDAGLHTITVTVTDILNNSATATINILVLNNAVFVRQLSPGPVAASGKAVTFTAVAPGFTNPSFTVTDNYAGTTVTSADINYSTGVFLWSPATNEQGPHTLTVGAYDGYGHNATVKQIITVIAPSVRIGSLNPGVVVPAKTTATFSVSTADLTSPSFSITDAFTGTSTLTTGSISTSGAFSWTPAASDIGTHTITVTASDASGNAASTTQMLIVTAPSLTPAPSSATPVTASPVPSTPPAATTTAMATAAKSGGYVFSTTLGIRSRGTAVTELQKKLALLGFYSGPATGYFGAVTATSVKLFQKAHGISAVGSVGPATRSALNH